METLPDILSNNFEGLDQPVAVHIGFAGRNKICSDEELENIKKKLQSSGIKATLYNSPEAANSDTTVLTPTGIRSPILTQEKARAFAQDIEKAIENEPQLTYAYPVNLAQIPPVQKQALADDDKKFIDELLKDYAYKAGAYPYEAYAFDSRQDYEQRKAHHEVGLDDDAGYQAHKKREQVRQQYVQKFEEFTSKNKDAVYHGSMSCNPYEIITNKENKSVVYGTSQVFNAVRYSEALCGGGEYIKEDKTLHISDEGSTTFGFLHLYQKATDQRYYFDFGMEERGAPHEFWAPHNDETPILKHKNKHAGSFLIVSQAARKIPVPIDLNAPEWKRYQALTTPVSHDYSPYLEQRLEAQRQKIKENPAYAETYKKEKNEQQKATSIIPAFWSKLKKIR